MNKSIIGIIISGFLYCVSLANEIPLKFERISTEQGLSQACVNCIYRDSKGFLWIGTNMGGLNRYDGYSFKVYNTVPGDSNSLSHAFIQFIYENPSDGRNSLWIGTQGGGLNRFDRNEEKFYRYKFHNEYKNDKDFNLISSYCQDSDNYIWISSIGGGLIKFCTLSDQWENIRHDSLDDHGLSSDETNFVYKDSEGYLWVGTLGSGIDLMDQHTGKFYNYRNNSRNPHSLSNDNIWCIYQDDQNNLWIGTESGLNKLYLPEFWKSFKSDKNYTPIFERFLHYSSNPSSISANWILSICEDSEKYLWFSIYGGGINRLDKDANKFISYKHSPSDPESIDCNEIRTIYNDTVNHILWIGTDGSGLSKAPLKSKEFIKLSHTANGPASLSSNDIFNMYKDRYGNIWIGTHSTGIDRLNPETGEIYNYRSMPDKPASIPSNKVQAFNEDHEGRLWIGSMNGLSLYDRNKNEFINYKFPTIEGNWINSICPDPSPQEKRLWLGSPAGLAIFNYDDERYEKHELWSEKIKYGIWTIFADTPSENLILWIGTDGGGLYRLNLKTDKLEKFVYDDKDEKSIGDNTILCIYRDKSNILWIGTQFGGLNKFNEVDQSFESFGMHHGLPSILISTINEDEQGNLWIGTEKGLCKYDRNLQRFFSFDSRDGLNGNECWTSAKDEKENLYFGGYEGINVFNPNQITFNEHVPKIVFTDFKLFHKSVTPGRKKVLSKSIAETPEIILDYNQDVFSIEFSALDYTIPQKNKYAFQMEGVDKEWVYTDASQRLATYTRLSAGEYLFKVKGSNNDGIWNEAGASIKITILPPWWQTNLAYFIYLVLGIGLIGTIWRIQMNRIRIKHQREMEHLENEKLKEVDQAKSRFFTNISHEFRTPLTLIESPIKQFLDGDLKGNLKEHCKVVLKNTRRLLDLVNQLLDLSKLESGHVKLKACKQNLIPMVSGLVQSFESLAVKRNILFKFSSELNELDIYLDTEKFEKIINNLLSNAFKFTPEGGTISVTLNNKVKNQNSVSMGTEDSVQIVITNSGAGISPEQIPKVFDRFYQVNESNGNIRGGSGIGLALVKEYVELHSGSINILSTHNQLTSFEICLPLGRKHLSDDEIVLDKTENLQEAYQEDANGTITEHSILGEKPIDNHLSRVLIIEDNPDVRGYVSSILQPNYIVLQAENGREGLQKAHDDEPDLIISDVMMPEMDGYELCRRIKENIEISHIPVILLTARASQEEKYTGLNCGADDYIIKPFEAKELRLRIQSILTLKSRIYKKFKSQFEFDLSEVTITSADKKFFTQLIEIIHANYNKSDNIVHDISKELGVSLPTLTRKIRAIVDMTPSEFIRTIRLKKAKELLLAGYGNISEIAFEVGFNSLSYFTKCYKKQFGISPSQEIISSNI